MNKEFIPYDLAIQLKELGFDEPCIACYDKLNMLATYSKNLFEPKNYNTSGYCVSAPLYQQAFRWSRDNKHISQILYDSHNNSYWFQIDSKMGYCCEESFVYYEEAEIACLKKLIEMAKEYYPCEPDTQNK